MKTTEPSLVTRPEVLKFADVRDLRKHLDRTTKSTLIYEVSGLNHLRMGRDGTVRGRFRYTSQGLKQVLALAGPGAYRLVADLASPASRRPADRRSEYSFEDAVDIFNRVIARRLGRFLGKVRLVVNLKEGSIDGILGPRYELLENSALLDQAEAAVAGVSPKCRFHSALVVGRRLSVRYVHRDPLLTFGTPAGTEEVRGGRHFSNSEIGGEATVRAATVLHREATDNFSLGPWLGGRLVHAGRDFAQKIGRMFAAAAQVEQDPEVLSRRFEALHAATLGLTRDNRAEREQRMVLGLQRGGAPAGAATRAVQSAICYGPDPDRDGPPVPLSPRVLAGRNRFDLYCALTDTASGLYATAREAVEQAAYGLLLDRISLM